MTTELRYEVLVHDGVRRHRAQRLPDGSPIVSSPLASTLVFGDHDAALVDVPFTREQVARVGDWIERSGKRLAYIYATHGHGDHWFGTDLLMRRFPGPIAYAADGTIAMMHQQATRGRAERWDIDFPGLIPDSPVVYQPIPDDGFELEGHRLLAIETGHTDTDDTTVLHVPSIGLVVAGDVAWLTRSGDAAPSETLVAAGEKPMRALLYAGRPLREPVVARGPFVMNTEAEIEQAYADYRAGRFGPA